MQVMSLPAMPAAEARLLRWLAVAVLLHGALLLIPARDALRQADPLAPLRIALTTSRPTIHADTTIAAPAPDPRAMAPATAEPPPTAPPLELAPPEAPAPESAVDAAGEPEQPPLSAARLLELDRRREWGLQESGRQHRLGEFVPRPPPDNWRSGVPYRDDAPGGRAAPERVEIVDRWLAADGSHNVMVETPSGERLCGRAEAWDPLRPLVEPVMMFRSCGAAPPTFVWPDRYGGGHAR